MYCSASTALSSSGQANCNLHLMNEAPHDAHRLSGMQVLSLVWACLRVLKVSTGSSLDVSLLLGWPPLPLWGLSQLPSSHR